ncbi:MAG: excinuclease ABC subunit UvrC, partial [Candidatus Omnitrophica bacterium]|nr:excinuclease ABC subunit UvrC [Candidatus Omnitrophota bacterium]
GGLNLPCYYKIMDYPQTIREKILSAPDSCGVYLMRDCLGRVLYVGKAKALKKRLLNYLGRDLGGKTQSLMAKVADVEFRLAPNEAMALLLEFKLIHEFNPRYNTSLKDDKSFPFVRISREEFPSIQVTRKKLDAAGRYLGPYTNAKLLKNALKIIRLEFAYRTCRRFPKQSCIYQKINLCPAPCIGKISRKAYKQRIDNIILILKGKGDLLIRKLTKSMQDKSLTQDFEAAARMRDQIIILSGMSGQLNDSSCKNELELLARSLNLKKPPIRIEGFDISNLSGSQAVGAMVSFYNGQPDKNNYRRFRIKSFSGIDDYKMLAEVLRRRYSRLLKEKKALPDLLLIDGGKGHLLTAQAELKALNLHIPLVSIAKEKENIYSSQPGKLTVALAKDGPALNLIRRVRDEAHRFAVGYHRLLRQEDLFR